MPLAHVVLVYVVSGENWLPLARGQVVFLLVVLLVCVLRVVEGLWAVLQSVLELAACNAPGRLQQHDRPLLNNAP